jgi:CRISPR-associated exonuclease Cas4
VYPESQLLPISALQHLLFCERQCALIHVERLWAENRFTVEGQHLHRKAHGGREERRGATRIVRQLWVRSLRLGLVGQADVVEFEGGRGQRSEVGGQGEKNEWKRVTPIEYKRGRPKRDDSDRVQLCAQALCLEEMLETQIGSGELFYGQRQRRTQVEFDSPLRERTEAAAQRLHAMIDARETPPAVRTKKCDACSLIALCLPDVRFCGRQFAAALREAGPVSDPFDLNPDES